MENVQFDLIVIGAEINGKASDLAVQNGTIAKIAPAGSARAENWKAAKTLNGSNRVLTPGFYNAHTHAAMSLFRGYAEDRELFDWLNNHIWPLEAKLTEDDVYAGSRLAILEMLKSGTVFFADMYWFQSATVRAAAEMGIRASIGLQYITGPDGKISDANRRGNEALLALRADLPEQIQIAVTPHAVYTVNEPTLRQCAEFAEAENLRIQIHLAETAREVEDCRKAHGGMTPTEYLESIGFLSDRVCGAHCVAMTDSDLALIAERGAYLCNNPASNLKLCSGMFRFDAAEKAGCRIAIGTDGSCSNNNLSMLEEMKIAGLSAKYQSGNVTAAKASAIFRAATQGGAEAFGLAGGVIAEGRPADFLLIDLDDPFMIGPDLTANLVYSAESSAVQTVVIAGKAVMEDRIVPGEKEIIAEARAAFRSLLRR